MPLNVVSWFILRQDEKGNLKLEDVGSSSGSDDPREQVRHILKKQKKIYSLKHFTTIMLKRSLKNYTKWMVNSLTVWFLVGRGRNRRIWRWNVITNIRGKSAAGKIKDLFKRKWDVSSKGFYSGTLVKLISILRGPRYNEGFSSAWPKLQWVKFMEQRL